MPEENRVQLLEDRVRHLEGLIFKLVKSDRYVFDRDIEMMNGRSFIFGQGENVTDGTKIGRTVNERIGFYGADGTTQQSPPTWTALSTVSGTGDDSTINSNFSILESLQDDIIGVFRTIGITS